jgi:hypothetical protein
MAQNPKDTLKRLAVPLARPEPPGRGINRKKLAIIHIVKKEIGLEDQDYRCLLRRITGVDSSRELDAAGFRKLMRFFVRSRYYRVNPFGMTLKQKLYIKFLAHQLSWDNAHLGNFINKYYRREGLDDLTKKEASKVIVSLKAIRTHES